jgi:hypothetical protein
MDSMIVICSGSVLLTGAVTSLCLAGDVVQVPAGSLHGFRCGVGQTFHALSLQPGDTGIYTDASRSSVAFTTQPDETRVSDLEADAAPALVDFRAHAAIDFLRRKTAWDPQVDRFFASFALWSRQFHKLVNLRQKLNHGTPLQALVDWHFAEEVGHDRLLHARDGRFGPVGRRKRRRYRRARDGRAGEMRRRAHGRPRRGTRRRLQRGSSSRL